jgi:DNA-binding response OmpR family regulator
VEKSSDLQLLYTDALASPGCGVDVAEDGATAWEALQARRYHLLITENELPDRTGEALIMKLRSARMDLPVVLVEGGLLERELAADPPLPCAATLMKPFALDMLLDTVNNVLRAVLPTPRSPDSLPSAIPIEVGGKQRRKMIAAGQHFVGKNGAVQAESANLWAKGHLV